MSYEYVKVNGNNINEFSNIWLETIQIVGRGASFNNALIMMRNHRSKYLDAERMFLNNTRLDFYYYIRVLKYEGQPVSFIHGIIRYFDDNVFLQIGSFATLKRIQKRGHGARLLEFVEEELKNKGVNYTWGMMQNEGFWEKQGYILDDNQFLREYYPNINPDNSYYKHISNNPTSLENFFCIFDEEYGVDIYRNKKYYENPNEK